MGKRTNTATFHKGTGSVPTPSRSNQKYPWNEMAVGDYVVINNKSRASYAANAMKFCERRGLKREFTYRGPATNPKKEHRIYRLK